MADGPGARIVDRVGVLVLPDTSKFQPALKKYLERVSRTAKVEVGVDLDESGLTRDAKAATAAASRGATVKASADLSDGFLSQMQRDVTAAMRQIEADVPLTADGERLRREARTKVASLQSQMASMALEVPLDPEAGAAQKADLRGEIAELQAIASRNEIDVPVDIGRSLGSVGSSGFGSMGTLGPALGIPAALAGAIALGGVLASLPAIMMGIAIPVGAIALGWEGIALAAKEAKPGFEALQTAVESRFAEDLAPVFASLGDALPQLIPAFEGLASALSGAFGEVIGALTSPEGLAKVDGIIRNITEAIEILSPVLGPMVQTFLDFALIGTQTFVDNAPMLLGALEQMNGLFQFLADSGILSKAVEGFIQMMTFGIILAGALSAVAIGLSAIWMWGTQLIAVIGGALLGAFNSLTGVILNVARTALPAFLALPGQIMMAIISLPGMLIGFFMGLWSRLQAATSGGAGRVIGVFMSLPARALAAVLSMPGLLVGLIQRTWSQMTSSSSGGLGRVINIIGQLPARALGVILSLPGLLVGVIVDAFGQMTSSSSGGVGRVVGIIGGLPARALGVVVSLPGLLMGVIIDAFGRMAGAAGGGVGRVVGIISGLGGSIMGAIAGIPGQLYSAGASMISSLASGMTSKLSSVSSAAYAAARKVASAFPGSPVKEGPLKSWNYGGGVSGAGRKLIGGLAAGMNAERSSAARAARGVAGSIAGPVSALDLAGAGGSVDVAVERALTGWQPVVALSGREFKGSMVRTNRERQGR